MCKFFSAIVTRDGHEVLWSEYSDSHSELIQHFGLKDDGRKDFAKIEFTPKDDKSIADIDSYTLRLDNDEYATPEWWNDEVAEKVAVKCRAILRACIVPEGKRVFALGGLHIVVNASIEVRWGRVFASGSSQVTAFDSSQVTASGSSQVTASGSSQVTASGSSQVFAYGSSQVTAYGSSRVTAYGSSRVTASDSSRVTAYDSSQVFASGSSRVTAFDSSRVTASGSSQVFAYGSSQVTASGSSRVTDNRIKK